jgi:hypothetical protein
VRKDLIKLREQIFDKAERALDKAWPARRGDEYVNEMVWAARQLEIIAKEMQSTGFDRIEQSRTYRYLGNLYSDLVPALGEEMFIPDQSQEQFRAAVNNLSMTLNLMRSMDPLLSEITKRTLIANPLQPVQTQGQAGAMGGHSAIGQRMASYHSAPKPSYAWRSGNSMGVNFAGGGGVATDGRDIFVL